jgi:hypothetical protein
MLYGHVLGIGDRVLRARCFMPVTQRKEIALVRSTRPTSTTRAEMATRDHCVPYAKGGTRAQWVIVNVVRENKWATWVWALVLVCA